MLAGFQFVAGRTRRLAARARLLGLCLEEVFIYNLAVAQAVVNWRSILDLDLFFEVHRGNDNHDVPVTAFASPADPGSGVCVIGESPVKNPFIFPHSPSSSFVSHSHFTAIFQPLSHRRN